MGVWLRSTFPATPLPCVMKRLFVSLQVSALIRGSLPRPWGEGGPPDGGPGEGQPTGIAPQNVQTSSAIIGIADESNRVRAEQAFKKSTNAASCFNSKMSTLQRSHASNHSNYDHRNFPTVCPCSQRADPRRFAQPNRVRRLPLPSWISSSLRRDPCGPAAALRQFDLEFGGFGNLILHFRVVTAITTGIHTILVSFHLEAALWQE